MSERSSVLSLDPVTRAGGKVTWNLASYHGVGVMAEGICAWLGFEGGKPVRSLSAFWSLTVLPVMALEGKFHPWMCFPCGSGKGCCLFGHGDHLGSGLGEAVAMNGCFLCTGDALVRWNRLKMMKVIALTRHVVRGRPGSPWGAAEHGCRMVWQVERKSWWLLLSIPYGLFLQVRA